MALILVSLLVGTMFGAGLSISGMINPQKVLDFLDLAGNWDPTLAAVMVGAILGAWPGFHLARKRKAPVLDGAFQLPTRRSVDPALLVGAVLFGIGWALVGFCPGPAVAALGSGQWQVLVFVAAMLAGMIAHRVLAVVSARKHASGSTFLTSLFN